MLRFLCFTLLASLVSAGVITFKDCGHAEVKSVEVSSCSSSPCTLHKGKDVTLNVHFTANQDTKSATIAILAKIGELEIQIPGFDTDACNGHLECPLKKGQNYTLHYSMTIPGIAPTIEADVTAKLVGDHGVLGCGTIHGSIKD